MIISESKNKLLQFFLLQIKRSKKVPVSEHNINLLKKNSSPSPGFDPSTFWLDGYLALGISSHRVLQLLTVCNFFSFQVCHLYSAKVPEVDCKRPKNHKTLETDHLSGRVLNFLAKRIGNFVTALQSTNAKSKPIETDKYFFFVFLEHCGDWSAGQLPHNSKAKVVGLIPATWCSI